VDEQIQQPEVDEQTAVRQLVAALRHGCHLPHGGEEVARDGTLDVACLPGPLTAAEWLRIAENSDRLMVIYSEGSARVKAVRGHSLPQIEDEPCYGPELRPHQVPHRVWHATRRNAVRAILATGLVPGGPGGQRLHVHCSQQQQVKPGRPVLIGVYAREAAAAGCSFHRAGSGCIITRSHIHPEFLVALADSDCTRSAACRHRSSRAGQF
jgi:RNA:NAD 2'-phosphotransferase (TPT1/KptA family)